MQFSTVAITLFAALAAASPLERRQLGGLCGSALDTPQCCDVSVGGLANLNCASRMLFRSSNPPNLLEQVLLTE